MADVEVVERSRRRELILRRAGRPRFAVLLNWPKGTQKICHALEDEHPDWLVWYHAPTESRRASWAAVHLTGYGWPDHVVGSTHEELRVAIKQYEAERT